MSNKITLNNNRLIPSSSTPTKSPGIDLYKSIFALDNSVSPSSYTSSPELIRSITHQVSTTVITSSTSPQAVQSSSPSSDSSPENHLDSPPSPLLQTELKTTQATSPLFSAFNSSISSYSSSSSDALPLSSAFDLPFQPLIAPDFLAFESSSSSSSSLKKPSPKKEMDQENISPNCSPKRKLEGLCNSSPSPFKKCPPTPSRRFHNSTKIDPFASARNSVVKIKSASSASPAVYRFKCPANNVSYELSLIGSGDFNTTYAFNLSSPIISKKHSNDDLVIKFHTPIKDAESSSKAERLVKNQLAQSALLTERRDYLRTFHLDFAQITNPKNALSLGFTLQERIRPTTTVNLKAAAEKFAQVKDLSKLSNEERSILDGIKNWITFSAIEKSVVDLAKIENILPVIRRENEKDVLYLVLVDMYEEDQDYDAVFHLQKGISKWSGKNKIVVDYLLGGVKDSAKTSKDCKDLLEAILPGLQQ